MFYLFAIIFKQNQRLGDNDSKQPKVVFKAFKDVNKDKKIPKLSFNDVEPVENDDSKDINNDFAATANEESHTQMVTENSTVLLKTQDLKEFEKVLKVNVEQAEDSISSKGSEEVNSFPAVTANEESHASMKAEDDEKPVKDDAVVKDSEEARIDFSAVAAEENSSTTETEQSSTLINRHMTFEEILPLLEKEDEQDYMYFPKEEKMKSYDDVSTRADETISIFGERPVSFDYLKVYRLDFVLSKSQAVEKLIHIARQVL